MAVGCVGLAHWALASLRAFHVDYSSGDYSQASLLKALSITSSKGFQFPLSSASAVARSNELGSLGFLSDTYMRITEWSVRNISKVAMIIIA